MMLNRTLAAAALAAALAAPAFAQQQPAAPSPATNPPAATQTDMNNMTFVKQQQTNEWRGSRLIGASIYGPDNSSIGDVNDVLVSGDGNIRAVIVGVGGFLGVGEKDVALPFAALTIQRSQSGGIDKIKVSYTKEQLKDAPRFAFYQSGQSQTTGASDTNSMKNDNMMKNGSK
jgi:hypothetical protein